MYEKHKEALSFADYIVLGSYTAAQVAAAKDSESCGGRCSLTLNFKSGRKDCADPNRHKSQSLPEGHDVDAPRTHVKDQFGLSDEEMVAIMGKLVDSR